VLKALIIFAIALAASLPGSDYGQVATIADMHDVI